MICLWRDERARLIQIAQFVCGRPPAAPKKAKAKPDRRSEVCVCPKRSSNFGGGGDVSICRPETLSQNTRGGLMCISGKDNNISAINSNLSI